MTYEVVFSAGADDDLDEIEEYLSARFSETDARRYIEWVLAYCLGLAKAPHRGSTHNDIREGLRKVGFERRITIAFEIVGQRVVILGVSYGGRRLDWI